MTITVGEKFPNAQLMTLGANGPEAVDLGERLAGRKVIVFGLPGAYTGPCSTTHIPSFMRTAKAFGDKGVEEIICVAVNDPFVLNAWGESTGATAAGITILGDSEGKLTHALKMEFSAPHLGLIGRSNRYAVVLDDGVITHANIDKPGECDISTGEALLAAL
ncbi:MAG: peroxiredoxin [Rhodobacter sp.]|nr:peroxiredoxin [Rhodobacter sp.]